MKVTSIHLYSSTSTEPLVLSFRDPANQERYQVKGIDGLAADDISRRYYGMSGGSAFYDLAPSKRDIVVRIGLNPRFDESESYSDLRDALYRMIAASRSGLFQLQFNTGSYVDGIWTETTVAHIFGYVSKFEASHFSDTPEAQLTISCDYPLLRAMEPVSVAVDGLNPLDTTINDPLSTASHGVDLVLTFTGPLDHCTIRAYDDSWEFRVVYPDGFVLGDEVHILSDYNSKAVYFVRMGDTVQLGDVIQGGAMWPILFPGENRFVCSADVQWTSITYYPTYWGM